MKKLLLIPFIALIVWGGYKLYRSFRPPTPAEIIRTAHESLPAAPKDLPIIITPTPPDVHVTEKPRVQRKPAKQPAAPSAPKAKPVAPKAGPAVPSSRPAAPLQCVAEETPVPVVPRCLFWGIGEPGCENR